MAKEYEIQFVMGSDSHSPMEVGKNIDKFKNFIKKKNLINLF